MTPAFPGSPLAHPKMGACWQFPSGRLYALGSRVHRELLAATVAPARFISLEGGWGCGKTTGLVLAMLCAATQCPGEKFLIVTDTHGRYQRVLEPEMDAWLGGFGWTVNRSRSLWTDPATGTQIQAVPWFQPKSRAAESNRLEGMNASRAFIDECQTMTKEVAQRVTGRLRGGRVFQVVMAGLPMEGEGWWVHYARERDGTIIKGTSWDNPALPEHFLEEVQRLPRHVYEAMVMGRPLPPEDLVYSMFSAKPWPEGNLTPPGWEPDPEARYRLAGDFGIVKPSFSLICEDPEMGDVVVANVEPRDVGTRDIAAELLKVMWPRGFGGGPPDAWPIDDASGDRSGMKRDDHTLKSTFQFLAQNPPAGLGVRFRWPKGAGRTNIRNGVELLQHLIGTRRWLVHAPLWWEMLQSKQENNLAKSLRSYRRDDNGDPIKDGREDPCDAVRYDAVCFRWGANRVRPHTPSRSTPRRERKPRTHGIRRGGLNRGKL